MYSTDFKETTTIVNAGSPEECEELLRQNREAVERLKRESQNPAFMKNNNNNNYNTNGFSRADGNNQPRQQQRLFQGQNRGREQGTRNQDDILDQLREANQGIRNISQELTEMNQNLRNSQVGSSPNQSYSHIGNSTGANNFNNGGLNRSYTPANNQNTNFNSLHSSVGDNYNNYNSNNNYNNNNNNNRDLSESYKRTFVKCEGLEYEEYIDDLDRNKNFKAIREGPNGQWQQVNYTPAQIRPILEAKQRIERTVEEEKRKAEQSSMLNQSPQRGNSISQSMNQSRFNNSISQSANRSAYNSQFVHHS